MRPPGDSWRTAPEAQHASTHPQKSASKTKSTVEGTQEVLKTSTSSVAEHFILPTTSEGTRDVAGDVRRKADGPSRAQPPPRQQPPTPSSSQFRQHRKRASRSKKIGDDGDSTSDSGSNSPFGRHDHGGPSTKRAQRTANNKTFDTSGSHINHQALEKEEQERMELFQYLQKVSRGWNLTRKFRNAQREKGAQRIFELLRVYDEAKQSPQSRAHSSWSREQRDHQTEVLSEGTDETTWMINMKKSIKQWDTLLRRDTFADVWLNSQEYRPAIETLEEIIPFVEELVLERLWKSGARNFRHDPNGPVAAYENIATAVEQLAIDYRLSSIEKSTILMFPRFDRLNQLVSSLVPFLRGDFRDEIGPINQAIVCLAEVYRILMETQIAVDVGRVSGIILPDEPRLGTHESYESFGSWLRKSRIDGRLSQEYVDSIFSIAGRQHISRICRYWENDQKKLGGSRREFFLGMRHPDVISMVISKEDSPIKIKDMSVQEVVEMGWFCEKEDPRYWRHELINIYKKGTREGEDVVFRVTMDGEVLGVHLPNGEWRASKHVSEIIHHEYL